MEYVSVIAAAAAAWIFGAVWYGINGKAWMAAAGLTEDSIDRKNPVPYIASFILAVLVAGMMRHVFTSSGVTTVGAGAVSGLGMGAFIAAPWLVTNYLYAQRPKALMVIDGLYAIGGCTVIGAVLMLV